MNRRQLFSGITVPSHHMSILPTVQYGNSYNRSTSGKFHRLTGWWLPREDLLISDSDAFIWDVRNTGTYSLRFVTSQSGTTILHTITTSQVVEASGAITFTPDSGALPIVLKAGNVYYLQLYKTDAPEVTWWDYNTTFQETYLSYGGCYYETSAFSYAIPCRVKVTPIIFTYDYLVTI